MILSKLVIVRIGQAIVGILVVAVHVLGISQSPILTVLLLLYPLIFPFRDAFELGV